MSTFLNPSRALEFNAPIHLLGSPQAEIDSSKALVSYLDSVYPLADTANTQHREGVLNELVALFRQWICQVCVEKGVYGDLETAAEAGGAMFVSGSFKLGINSPDGDIDIVGIAPQHVTIEDFFTSLPPLLLEQPGITSLLPIPKANVPIIELVFHGVSIDLLFASIPLSSVPSSLNILDDAVLAGLKEQSTLFALNGPRANEIIYRSVPNPETFKARPGWCWDLIYAGHEFCMLTFCLRAIPTHTSPRRFCCEPCVSGRP
jgi:poly(A) polymerase